MRLGDRDSLGELQLAGERSRGAIEARTHGINPGSALRQAELINERRTDDEPSQ
jgi:hypothetical protein